MSGSIYIIAEAGVNHNGSLEMAKKLVCAAKESGVDAVKFQTFKAENLVTKKAKQADYQIENLGGETSQLEMLKKLELTNEEYIEIKRYCDELHIEFLSTPFDFESLDFLIDKIGLKTIKVPSGEITNAPFLHYIATKRKRIILSTGMATVDEIHQALAFIAYGIKKPKDSVSIEKVIDYYKTEEAKSTLEKYVTLLHCTTEYPAPYETINLRAITSMKSEFELPLGLSDHSMGIAVPIAAVALQVEIIEKHFTLDKTLEGPDHVASLTPIELNLMVKCIRDVEKSLGDGNKKPTEVEFKNRIPARKSIVAKKHIAEGEHFTVQNLTVKRPGNGISPIEYWNYIGKSSLKKYDSDDLINE